MTDLEKLITLLKAESPTFSSFQIPTTVAEQRQLLRALMNVRMPKPLSAEVIHLQDVELQSQFNEKGVVSLSGEGIILWQGDITRLNVDAIVNAANSKMLGCFVPGHHCIDNAIHSAAGLQLRQECAEKMQGREAATAEVVVTKAYNLPSKYVMHVTGPIIPDGIPIEVQKEQLRQCYANCLDEADRLGLRSIAFCCISTGVFSFPNVSAAEIAVETVREYLDKGIGSVKQVIFNVFKEVDLEIYRRILA